jgi:DNA-binding response OmpR family regulator
MPETEPKTVLAVAYNPALGRMIKELLLGENFAVEVTESLEEARERINGAPLRAVITDWTRVNGLEVIKYAREKMVETIIVMNGGLISDEQLEQLEETGVDVIDKPFDIEDLINLVRREAIKTTET